MKQRMGPAFPVTDPDDEQPRADRFEISPTGILFGSRAPWATGEPGQIDDPWLPKLGTTPESFVEAGAECGFRGERRALRITLEDLAWSLDDSTSRCPFRSASRRLCHERPSGTDESNE